MTTATKAKRTPADVATPMPADTPPLAAIPADGLPAQLAYLTRALKIPTISRCWEDLADQARDENWSHEEYLAALLGPTVSPPARQCGFAPRTFRRSRRWRTSTSTIFRR